MSFYEIWSDQILLQKLISDRNLPAKDFEFIRESALGVFTELGEALAIDKRWKTWKESTELFSESDLKEEIADVWLFIINFSLANGINYDEMVEIIKNKQDKNFERFVRK